MEWLVLGGLILLARNYNKIFADSPSTGHVRTIKSVRSSYENNLKMIERLPLTPAECEAARESARQKMLRELDELMS